MPAASIADRRIEGVVFDMDGVLLDSEPLHHLVVNELLAEDGASLSVDEYLAYVGTTLEDTWGDLVRRFGLRRSFEYYRDRYDEAILRQYAEHSEPLPGVVALVRELGRLGLRLAVASSSRTAWVHACLTRLGLFDCFQVIVTGDMVSHGKPEPEIYLLAARQLDLPPERCLAVEDAPKGAESAHRAGMVVVAVNTPYTRDVAVPHADLRIDGLEQFDVGWLKAAA